MKFEDLKFKKHWGHPSYDKYVRVNLENGNGISIINGESAYCDKNTYEIAPLLDDKLIFIPSWGDQVAGNVTKEEINDFLYAMENMDKAQYFYFCDNYFKNKNKIIIMNPDRYIVMDYPDSLELSSLPDFEQHIHKITNEKYIEKYGEQAYFVDVNWLEANGYQIINKAKKGE